MSQEPKKRLIKDFDKLEKEFQQKLKLEYPDGFTNSLVSYYDKEGKRQTAVPYATDEIYYLIRIKPEAPRKKAKEEADTYDNFKNDGDNDSESDDDDDVKSDDDDSADDDY